MRIPVGWRFWVVAAAQQGTSRRFAAWAVLTIAAVLLIGFPAQAVAATAEDDILTYRAEAGTRVDLVATGFEPGETVHAVSDTADVYAAAEVPADKSGAVRVAARVGLSAEGASLVTLSGERTTATLEVVAQQTSVSLTRRVLTAGVWGASLLGLTIALVLVTTRPARRRRAAELYAIRILPPAPRTPRGG